MPFTLPDLPFPKDAFEPTISTETFDYHHGKHHQAYVTKANQMVEADSSLNGKSLLELIHLSKNGANPALFNQVGQIWNHSFYWQCLTPQSNRPMRALAARIIEDFGDEEKLIAQLKAEAIGHFGSGWTALVLREGKITIASFHDADTPIAHDLAPLLILDLWEHAYYIDYRNARPDHIDALLEHAINWDFVAKNLDEQGASRADQPG